MKKSRSKPKYNWTGRVELEDFIIPDVVCNELIDILNIDDEEEKIIKMLYDVKLAVMMHIGFSKVDKSAPRASHILAATKEVYDTATELTQLIHKLDDITNDFIFKNTKNLDENHNVKEYIDITIGHHLVTVPLSSGPDKTALNKELQSLIHSCLRTYELLDGKESRGRSEDTDFPILIERLNNIFEKFYIDIDMDVGNEEAYEPPTNPERLRLDFINQILKSVDLPPINSLTPYLS